MIFLTYLLMTMNTTIQPISFNFNQLTNNQIMIVNDSVMGGKSDSKFENNKTNTEFSGKVSLKNNGGFASLRMIWPFQESSAYNKLQLRLIGDGKTYQFRLRTNKGLDGAAYVYEFKTIKDKNITVDINLHDFKASFRGRTLMNATDLKLSDVKQMGFLIAEKQVGNFSIDLESITLMNQ